MGRTRDRASVKTGFLTVTALGLALGLARCDRDRTEPAPTPAPPAPVVVPTELARADLIAALARAASAFAAGADPSSAAGLSGRTFRIRLPFGCSGVGETASDGFAGLLRAGDGGGLTLSARPLDWSRSPLVVPPGVTPDWDGVEGFWIARPWLSQETCPARVERPAPAPAPIEDSVVEAPGPILLPVPPPSPQTMGLAAIQAADSSRLGRRDGEAYRFTVRGTGDAPVVPPAQGYRLVLGGRVGAFPDGRAVHCTARSAEERPVCVAAVELDVVAFEDAAGARLSEWRPTA
jgi:hypothetical protein